MVGPIANKTITTTNSMSEENSVNEFLSSTSLHGVRFLAHRSKSQKIFWSILLVICFLSLYFTVDKYIMYFATSLMRTEVEMHLASEEGVQVPTVTLCTLNQFKRSKLEENPEMKRLVESLYNNSFDDDDTIMWAMKRWLDEERSKENGTFIQGGFLRTLRAAADTPWVFKIRFRNRGVYTDDRTYSRNLFKKILIKDKICIDLNTTYLAEIRNEKELRFRRSGHQHALQIFLFTNRSEETVGEPEARGIKLVIHDPDEKPGFNLLDKGIFAATNTAVFIGLTKSTLRIRTQKTFGRPSKNEYEKCRLDCWMYYVAAMCQCIWDNKTENRYYDKEDVTRICETAEDWGCMHAVDETALQEIDTNERICEKCKLPAVDSDYEASVSTATFPTKHLLENVFRTNRTSTLEDLDFHMISIYMLDPMEKITEITEIDGVSAFLSDLGGAMGLLVGASVLTVIEIVQFGFIRLQMFFCRWKKNKDKRLQNGREMEAVS